MELLREIESRLNQGNVQVLRRSVARRGDSEWWTLELQRGLLLRSIEVGPSAQEMSPAQLLAILTNATDPALLSIRSLTPLLKPVFTPRVPTCLHCGGLMLEPIMLDRCHNFGAMMLRLKRRFQKVAFPTQELRCGDCSSTIGYYQPGLFEIAPSTKHLIRPERFFVLFGRVATEDDLARIL